MTDPEFTSGSYPAETFWRGRRHGAQRWRFHGTERYSAHGDVMHAAFEGIAKARFAILTDSDLLADQISIQIVGQPYGIESEEVERLRRERDQALEALAAYRRALPWLRAVEQVPEVKQLREVEVKVREIAVGAFGAANIVRVETRVANEPESGITREIVLSVRIPGDADPEVIAEQHRSFYGELARELPVQAFSQIRIDVELEVG